MNELDDKFGASSQAADLRPYLRPLWRWKWVIAIVVIVAAAGTYFLSSREAKRYVSSTNVYVTNPDPAATVESGQPISPPNSQSLEDLSELFTDQAATVTVYNILRMAVGSAGSVSVSPLVASGAVPTSLLVVTATSGSPALAARLANVYVSVFRASQKAAQKAQAVSDLQATRQALNSLADTPANAAERQTLLTQESQLKTLALDPSAGATQINTAVAPSAPVSPKPARDAVLGAIIGLLLAVGIAFGLELLDRRLVRVSSVESMYRFPVLAVLPHVRNPTPTYNNRAVIPPAFVEAMRSLRLNLKMASRDRPPRTVLVTSAVPGEGKSTVVRDLALVCAEAGEMVLIIDADLRRPSIAKLLGVDAEVGLAQVLRREAQLGHATVSVSRPGPASSSAGANGNVNGSGHANGNGNRRADLDGDPRLRGSVDLLSSGQRVPNPVALLSSAAMKSILAAAAGRYDSVIVDSAPLLAVADTVPLLEIVDAVVLVARLRLSTHDSADRLTSLIGRVPGARIAGIVTNDTRGGLLNEGYGQYGYGHDSRASPAATRGA